MQAKEGSWEELRKKVKDRKQNQSLIVALRTQGHKEDQGSLQMSPVTRLAQLLRPIFFSIRMENFTWVARDEIQETKPKWWNINLHQLQLSYMYM